MPTRATLLLAILLGVSSSLPAQDIYDLDTVLDYRLTFKQTNWWQLLQQNYASETDIRADLRIGALTLPDVGVRIRGNTSYTWNSGTQKIPLNIRTDAFVANQELGGYKNLNLQNAYKDATFVREPVAYLLMRQHIPSLGANWVKLWINDVYWGVYVNIQQPNRDFLEDWFTRPDGNLYRGDSPQRNTRPTLTYLGTDWRTYAAQYDHKTQSHPKPWVDLIELTRVLDTDPLASLPQTLPKVLDIDRALWYLALQTLFSNTDSYIGTGNDYLVFHDELHGRFSMMPWDLNTTFGGYDWPGKALGAEGLKRMDPFYDGGTSLRRPLNRLWQIPEWRQRYLAHYRTMLDDWFDWRTVGPIVQKYHKMLEPFVVADTKKLYTTQQFYDNLTKDVTVGDCCGSYVIPGLQSFMETKRAFLLTHAEVQRPAPSLAELGHAPARPKPTESVAVTARVTGAAGKVTLEWRVTGPYQEAAMFDDGQHGDGAASDGVWGAFVPPQAPGALVEYVVSAGATAAPDAPLTFLPRLAGHAPRSYRVSWTTGPSPVLINELLAKNDTGVRDEKQEREDWIELVNTSTQPFDASGHYLTDDLANPTKWAIPAATTIPAGGTLLVWADEDPLDGPLHATFKLAREGELVALFDPTGKTQLDLIEFGWQEGDIATGRPFDGLLPGVWTTLFEPSPGRLNFTSACGTRRYSALDSRLHPIALSLDALPRIAARVQMQLAGGLPSSVFLNLLAVGPAYQVLDARLTALIGLPLVVAALPSDTSGKASLPFTIPDSPGLVGARVYFQALGLDAKGLFGSNALEMTFCGK